MTWYAGKRVEEPVFYGQYDLKEGDISTSLAVESYAKAALTAPGTFISVRDLGESVLDSSPKISQEQWKNGEFYRNDIEWHDGMRQDTAAMLAERSDRRKFIGTVLSNTTTGQDIIGFAAGLGAGIVDPVNIAAGAAAAWALGPAAGAIPVLKPIANLSAFVNKARTVKAAAASAALEGALGTALTEPIGWGTAAKLQEDYTFADTLMNFTTSVGASALFGAAGGMYARKSSVLHGLDNVSERLNMGADVSREAIINDYHIEVAAEKQRTANERDSVVQSIEKERANMRDEQANVELMHDTVKDLRQQRDYAAYNLKEHAEGADVNISERQIYDALQVILDAKRTYTKSSKGLLKEISDLGGVKDYGGELSAMGVTSKTFPGFLRGDKGRDLDDMALALWERNIIGNPGGDRPTVDELLQEIDAALHGRRVDIDDRIRSENAEAAERFLSDAGINSGQILNEKSYARPEVKAIDKEIDDFRKRIGGRESVMGEKRVRIDELEKILSRLPSDEVIQTRAREAMRSRLEEQNIELDFPEPIYQWQNGDSSLELEINRMMEEDGLPAPKEFAEIDRTLARQDEISKAIFQCNLGA